MITGYRDGEYPISEDSNSQKPIDVGNKTAANEPVESLRKECSTPVPPPGMKKLAVKLKRCKEYVILSKMFLLLCKITNISLNKLLILAVTVLKIEARSPVLVLVK